MKFLNAIKQLFTSTTSKQNEEAGRFMPEKILPADQRFASNFTKNGGKLVYCENKQEIREAFINILKEIGTQNQVLCLNHSLLQEFSQYYTFSVVEKQSNAAIFLSNCENLIADNGSILFTANQIEQKKFTELPNNFIIVATTSQLVNNLRDALANINSKYKKDKPSNISYFSQFAEQTDTNTSVKNTFLLLLENLDTP